MATEQTEAKKDNWKFRRLMAFSCVYSMLAMLGYLTIFGSTENAVQAMIASSLPVGIVGVVVSYVIGPVADDWLQMRVNRST